MSYFTTRNLMLFEEWMSSTQPMWVLDRISEGDERLWDQLQNEYANYVRNWENDNPFE